MTKLSILLKIKIIAKRVVFHLFPENYECLKHFALEARDRGFVVTIKESFLPNLNSQNFDTPTLILPYNISGLIYFHIKGIGNGSKRDIVCDIPIGYYDSLSDTTELNEKKRKEMKEIMGVLNSFLVPVKVREVC